MGRFKTNYWVALVIAVIGIVCSALYAQNGNVNLGTIGRVFTGYSAIWAALRMYRLGTMIRTVWGRINYFFLAMAFIAFILRVQYWPWSGTISMVLLFIYPLYYTVWFATKPQKALDDVLKVVWLWVHCTLVWGIIQHVFEVTIWYIVADLALLFITYYLVLKAFPSRYRPKEPEWDFDRVKP